MWYFWEMKSCSSSSPPQRVSSTSDMKMMENRALGVSLSVVLVLVCSLPNVTHPRPTGVHSRCPGVMSEIDTLFSPTGNFNIMTLDHLLKNNAIAGNTKHFDDEMNLAGSVGLDGMKVDNIVQTFVSVPVDS